MTIRVGALHDLAALADLHARAFARGWSEGSLKSLMSGPGVSAFVSEREDIEGFILIRVAADEAEILTIAVSPDARRLGLASDLLDRASRHAACERVGRMFLEVAAANIPAIGLYEKHGFRRVGYRKAYYEDGGDALILSANLPLAMGKPGKTL